MFKRNKERTPKQKAEKAQLNIFARLAGCGFLIYYTVQILKTPKDDIPGTTAVVIAIVFMVLAAFVIGMTIVDLVRGVQTGRYKASTYEDEELIDYLERKQAENPDGDVGDTQQELEPQDDDDTASDTEEKDS